jgi:hypothetical protein
MLPPPKWPPPPPWPPPCCARAVGADAHSKAATPAPSSIRFGTVQTEAIRRAIFLPAFPPANKREGSANDSRRF